MRKRRSVLAASTAVRSTRTCCTCRVSRIACEKESVITAARVSYSPARAERGRSEGDNGFLFPLAVLALRSADTEGSCTNTVKKDRATYRAGGRRELECVPSEKESRIWPVHAYGIWQAKEKSLLRKAKMEQPPT
jgi:hypothetical protein